MEESTTEEIVLCSLRVLVESPFKHLKFLEAF